MNDLIEAIPYGVVVIDHKWKILTWNQAAKKITGYSAKQVLGKNLKNAIKFIKIQDRSEDYSIIENTFSTGKTQGQNENIVIVTSNNEEVPLSCTTGVLFGRLKKVTGIIIIFRDTNEEKGTFRLRSDFNYLQHQLRTPLSSALWNLQMAIESPTIDKQTKDLVSTALNSIQSIKLLSNTLIEVSQVDQGLVTPNIQTVPIEQIVKSSLNAISDFAKSKSIKIEVESEVLKNKTTTDPFYCSRILEELLKNSVQYSDPKSVVKIQVSQNDTGTLFEVIDAGLGINPEENSMIFTKFFRGWNTSDKQPGAGLGLYLTLRYVKLLKGKIWFVSKPGEVTTFSVLIPDLHLSKNQMKNINISQSKI